jgi:hypothetical protein
MSSETGGCVSSSSSFPPRDDSSSLVGSEAFRWGVIGTFICPGPGTVIGTVLGGLIGAFLSSSPSGDSRNSE